MPENRTPKIAQRFRGFLPVIVDVETAGFNAETDALLEIAAVTVRMDDDGTLRLSQTISCHVEPFPGANLEQRALDFTGIDPFNPFRMAKQEMAALDHIFTPISEEVKAQGCTRAILVGHNAFFDLGFIRAAVERTNHKKSPFHSFSCFDTATLGGLAYGQTVLAKACQAADIPFDSGQAHSAIYDAERTAELFCAIVNRWRELGGCPLL
ncbi:MAG: ribonuclease T [Chromatiales bacterium]|nr:ribonuclease T [Chromatiales bacterium]